MENYVLLIKVKGKLQKAYFNSKIFQKVWKAPLIGLVWGFCIEILTKHCGRCPSMSV
jgi:hypothetical protein